MASPRGVCPVCARPVALTANGAIRGHGTRRGGSAAAGTGQCPGSGESPAAVDPVEAIAQRLHAAYYLDTKHEGRPWADEKQANRHAWRRAAAVALDLGARA